MSRQTFVAKRREIENALGRLEAPTQIELRLLRSAIDELEQLAAEENGGIIAPSELELPLKPRVEELHPVPELPKSERHQKCLESVPREILQLRHLKMLGKASKQKRQRLRLLENEWAFELTRILQDDAPPEVQERRTHLLELNAEISKRNLWALREWSAQCDLLQHKHEQEKTKWLKFTRSVGYDIRAKVISRLRSEVRRFEEGSHQGAPVHQLWWRFLPPPGSSEITISRLVTELRKAFSGMRIDELRIRYAYGLNPNAVYIGAGEFVGYLAFTFSTTSNVLLECPMEGNAAYIFSRDWETLSRLSKSQLLQTYPESVRRVMHGANADWRAAVRECLARKTG